MRRLFPLTLLAAALAAPALAADLAGTVFADRNGNGLPDPGESGVAAMLEVFGVSDGGAGGVDLTTMTAVDGTFLLGPSDLDEGCYVVRVTPPAGFRQGLQRRDCPGSGLPHPVGTRRYGSPRHVIDGLRAGRFLHLALGDSIAEPASACTVLPRDNADYVRRLGERLACVAPAAVTENEAIGGKESRHLLEPAGTCGRPIIPVRDDPDDRCDNVFDTIARDPQLVSISIGGNDWLGAEPGDRDEPFDPAEVRASVEALIDARANSQEILSALATELPTTDVVVNTVYDNEAYACASSDFHNFWIPIWMQMLREVIWGQGPRFQVSEVYPEYAHQDLNGTTCCGREGLVCAPAVDGIHPTREGAEIHLEKVWEAVGGVSLGPRDGIGAASNSDFLVPVVELVATRTPTVAIDPLGGATSPDAALTMDGAGATVAAGDGGGLVLSGFDATPAGIVPVQVVVAVRYRTDAPPPASDPADAHYFEASVDGSFAPATFTVTGWNTITPIVGAGPSAPAPNALPNVPEWRTVRALLGKNLADDGRVAGAYTFSRLAWSDLATLAVRLRGVTRGTPDPVRIEWDAAWIEVYGYRDSGAYTVYRAAAKGPDLVSAPNVLGGDDAPPYDDPAPAAGSYFYAVSDGATSPAPAVIYLTGDARGDVRIAW